MSVTLEVWAPRAARVEVIVAAGRVPMHARGNGWFACSDPALVPGIEYAFSLDGGPPTPDPRSREQPSGPHGASRLHTNDFAWTDAGFTPPPWPSAVLYELHVGTFTPEGTLDSAITRLEHLRELGVTHVALMPVADFPGMRGWGYDGVGLWAVHRAYGGPRALSRFVDACHARGLAVVLDVVYNHLGPDGNYLARFGPYFTTRYHTPWGEAVNLDDAGSDEVRRFFVENALAWIREQHIDGVRLDAVHALSDRSAVHFLEELSAAIRDLERRTGRRVVSIAESDLNDPRLLYPPELGGHGLDAQWSDDLHHALHAWLTGEQGGYYADFGGPEQVVGALQHAFVMRGGYSRFRRRKHGREPTGLGADRFVCYLQTHDQVGNRALGDRIGALAGLAAQRVGATLVLTAPFVPMLFQGEEWAASSPFLYFTDHQDEGLARAVSDGRRREFAGFGWAPESVPDPQALSTFERSRLDWSELERAPHAEMHAYYRRLLRLRRERPDLTDPRLSSVHARIEGPGVVVVERERTLVLAHAGASPVTLDVPPSELLLASEADAALDGTRVTVPPRSALVLGKRGAD